MDDQSLERWRDAVRRTKKALADSDPEAVHSLLKQLSGVQSALGKLAEGTVSRTTLAEAVSEALRRLLREDRAGLLPELDELLARVEASENVSDQLQDVRLEFSRLVEKLEGDLQRRIASSVEQTDGALAQKLDDLKVMVGTLPTLIPARNLLRKLADRLDRMQREIEQTLQRCRGELSAHVEASDLSRADLEKGLASANDALRRLEARVDAQSLELHAAVEALARAREDLPDRRSESRDPEEERRRSSERLEREVLRRLALDLRDVLREGLLAAEASPRRSIRELLGFLRREPEARSGSSESFRYRLETAVESLERLLAEGEIDERTDR